MMDPTETVDTPALAFWAFGPLDPSVAPVALVEPVEPVEPSPRLTVITACFNHGHFLAESIASVRAQVGIDPRVLRHVIVIDGATDDSEAVARAAAAEDDRITVIVLPENRGLAASHNTGVKASATPWLLKVDADDTIAPGYVAAILAAADEDPSRNVIFSECQLVDESGMPTSVYRYPLFDPARMIDAFMIPGPAAYRRELFDAVGGQDETLKGAEDWDFWVRAQLELGLVPHQIFEPLWRYRQHDGPRVSRDAIARVAEYQEHMWQHVVRHALTAHHTARAGGAT